MAVRFVEGFDTYPTPTTGVTSVASRWVLLNAAGSLVAGRFGGQAFFVSGNASIRANVPGAGMSQFTMGHAAFFTSLTGAAPSSSNWSFLDGTVVQCGVGIDASGFVTFWRGAPGSGTQIGTASPTPLVISSWYYIETEVVLSDTVGRISVYVNGALFHQVTGVDTIQTGGVTTCSAFQFLATGSSLLRYVDDIYVSDTATRLGECRVETLRPSADTATKNFVPNSGTTNFSRVNETLTDGDTSYVSSSTVNAEDLYELDNLSSTPATIHAVQNRIVARKDDAATRIVENRLKSGAAATVGGTPFALGSTYGVMVDIFELDPNTSAAWTGAAVNALQIGQRITT